jgi:heme/copper-type cytochrome/quinol oxidase subunit 4
VAFARAVAIGGIAWFWVEHRDDAFGNTWVIAWAVCCIAFELCASAALLVTARGRVPSGVAIMVAIAGFAHLAVCLIAFVVAGGFGRTPEWALAVGVFDNLVRVVFLVGVLWPVALARADAIETRYYNETP